MAKKLEQKTVITFEDEVTEKRLSREYEGILELIKGDVCKVTGTKDTLQGLRSGNYIIRKTREERNSIWLDEQDKPDVIFRKYTAYRVG